jgi:hypothetical protein
VIGVLEHIESVEHPAGSEVDRVHHLGVDLLQPRRELVEPDLIRLGRVPGQIQPARALLAGSDAVLPAIARDEVATGIPDGRDAELLDELDHVGAEAVLVGSRVRRFMDAVVYAAAQVLDERAEQAPIDDSDLEVRIDGEVCADHASLPGQAERGRGCAANRLT